MDILKETLKITENINYIFVNYYNKMPWNMKSSFPKIFQKKMLTSLFGMPLSYKWMLLNQQPFRKHTSGIYVALVHGGLSELWVALWEDDQ